MDRAIKLRAWDRITGELAPVAHLSQLTDPRYEVTQFAGVLDANGVEVWEGDILRWAYFDSEDLYATYNHWVVIFHNGCFGSVSKNGNDFSTFSDNLDWVDPDGQLRRLGDERVGTKYTDAHLLSERGEWEGCDTFTKSLQSQQAYVVQE